MRVLITGITGMVGTYLSKLYLDQGCELAGISRQTAKSRHQDIEYPWKHYAGDILDLKFLNRVLSEFRPDVVFHLASQVNNGQSWETETTTYQSNIQGSHNLFSAVLSSAPEAIVIPACSSAEYGIVPKEKHPIKEDTTPLHPISPYGVSKAAMEMMAHQFHKNFNLKVVLPRMFIHVGPDNPPSTALQSFAMQLAAIKLGLKEPVIRVGNLDSSRDFVDVRDGVRALNLIADPVNNGQIFNICTGKAWSIKTCLDMLIEISKVKVDVVYDPIRSRPSDESLLLGDPSKLNALGWKPQISFETTLKDIFLNWLHRLNKN